MLLINLKNKITRLFLYSLGFSFLLYTLAGCQQSKKKVTSGVPSVTLIKSKKDLSNIRVGYCSPSLNAPFYMSLSNAVQRNVEAYKMDFLSVDGRGDITKQVMGIEDMVSKGVNVLIIDPLDPEALVPTINKAVKSGIPVFIVDSYIDPKANYVVSVLADNQGNGELIGHWIVDKMGRTPIKLALISGANGNPVGRQKRMGFIWGVIERQLKTQGSSGLQILAQGWGGWNINGGLKAMEDILVAHPNINLVMAENDAMAIGALKAIEGLRTKTHLRVVGFDGQKDALKLIKEGKIAATALNSPANLGRLVVQSVVRYLNGEKENGTVIHTKAVLINKSNVDQYYNPNAPF